MSPTVQKYGTAALVVLAVLAIRKAIIGYGANIPVIGPIAASTLNTLT